MWIIIRSVLKKEDEFYEPSRINNGLERRAVCVYVCVRGKYAWCSLFSNAERYTYPNLSPWSLKGFSKTKEGLVSSVWGGTRIASFRFEQSPSLPDSFFFFFLLIESSLFPIQLCGSGRIFRILSRGKSQPTFPIFFIYFFASKNYILRSIRGNIVKKKETRNRLIDNHLTNCHTIRPFFQPLHCNWNGSKFRGITISTSSKEIFPPIRFSRFIAWLKKVASTLSPFLSLSHEAVSRIRGDQVGKDIGSNDIHVGH